MQLFLSLTYRSEETKKKNKNKTERTWLFPKYFVSLPQLFEHITTTFYSVFFTMSEKVFNVQGNLVYNDIHDNQNSLIIPQTATTDRFAKDTEAEDVSWTYSHFPYISNSKLSNAQMDEIDTQIERLASQTATRLLNQLLLYQNLGYIDVRNIPTLDLYNTLNDKYHLPYKYENFRHSRNRIGL